MAASAWNNAVNTAANTNASLPTGSCNFRPLSNGSRAPTCGCRRFWLDKPIDSQDGSHSVLCACGHHACFHDMSVDAIPTPNLLRHSSAPSIPSDHDSGRHISLIPGPRIRQVVPTEAKSSHGQLERAAVAPLPNDIWGGLNNFARWQQDPTWMPSTAPASIMSCDLHAERQIAPSEVQPVKRSSSSERPYTSLFPNMEGLMVSPTVQGTPTTEEFDPNPLRADVPSDLRHSEKETRPTRNESPEPANMDLQVGKIETREPSPVVTTKLIANKPQETPTTPTKTIAPDVQNILKSCIRRLDELETMSFSHVPVEEVQDKFELFDGRLLEMEYWKKDIDARLKPSGSFVEVEGSQATASFQDNGNANLLSRVSDMENRLADLETAQPSYANPWEIEVVLLPFGRRLKGIWHDSMDPDPKQSPSTPEEHPNPERSAKNLLASSHTRGAAWNADNIQAWASSINPWLWPKAPGPNNTIFKRLQSRGLVRTVTLTDPGAHGIWEAIKDTFADFIETQPCNRSNNQQQPYEALKEPFVPLRKVKRSSWLRYMGPHDLVTPAAWDLSFLNSGVFMHGKGGNKRLYLTTADGYIQPGNSGWTWQQIRDLPRYENVIARSGSLFSKEAPSEPFWEPTAPLDDAPSFDSFVSRCSSSLGKRRSACVTFAEDEDQGQDQDQVMQSPSAQSYTSSSSGDTITPRYTDSFPIITKKASSQSKRHNSPFCTPIAYQKRRRTSGSPGYRGGLEELTPRWSHEPPTPLMENAWETRSQCLTGPSKKRLSTPTAYATPHSHNVANIYLAMADGGGDTEVESVGSGAAESEKEWAGLDEDDGDEDEVSRSSSQSSYSGSEWMAEDDESAPEEDDAEDDGDSLYEP